jgi:hypothetical protein
MIISIWRIREMSEFSFKSEEEHKAALYDACSLIVNTFNQTDAFDSYDPKIVTPYQFMVSARNVLNQIAEA